MVGKVWGSRQRMGVNQKDNFTLFRFYIKSIMKQELKKKKRETLNPSWETLAFQMFHS